MSLKLGAKFTIAEFTTAAVSEMAKIDNKTVVCVRRFLCSQTPSTTILDTTDNIAIAALITVYHNGDNGGWAILKRFPISTKLSSEKK